MKRKFELKCNKIKGLTFHRSRQNWVSISLFTGEVQVWDFRNGFKITEFRDSEVCVRSIDFHPLQSLLAAGGDDFLIRGYDFSENKKSFELKGHVDFVRTVQFHHELPWLLSCSDDQTLRIWNWQSKTQLSVITGHSHYVMCARFHPSKDIIASGSLDSYLRIWDFSKLKSRFSSSHGTVYMLSNDVEATVVAETHPKGINWLEFHPTEDLIATCSDDKLIKVWKFTASGAYEESSLHGHNNNVSAIAFSPDGRNLVSNAEDFSVRLWDLKTGSCLSKFVVGEERQWTIAMHPQLPLVATGGDKSLMILSLSSERIHFDTNKSGVLVYFSPRDSQLKSFLLSTGAIFPLAPQQRTRHSEGEKKAAASLLLNPFSQGSAISGAVRIAIAGEPVLHIFSGVIGESFNITPIKAKQAVFISNEKVLTLGDDLKLRLIKLQGLSLLNDLEVPYDVDAIYQGSQGKAFLRSEKRIVAYDLLAKRELFVIEDEDFGDIRRVIWSPNKTHFAILTKFSVFVFDKKGKKRCTKKEDSRIKSAVWAPDNVLFYNTHEHIKFVLKDGEVGLVRSINKIMFLGFYHEQKLIAFDASENFEEIELDVTEIEFKNAFLKKKAEEVSGLLKDRTFLGKSMVSYLLNKKFNSIALQLTQDKETAFYLAFYSKNFVRALELAKELGRGDLFDLLGQECLGFGIDDLAEECFRHSNNRAKLISLYTLNGSWAKLKQLEADDRVTAFNRAILSGDLEERIQILSDAGQYYLAYATAVTYGFKEQAERIEKAFPDVKNKIRVTPGAPQPPSLRALTPQVRNNRNLLINTVDLDDVKAAIEELSEEEEGEGGVAQLVTVGAPKDSGDKVDITRPSDKSSKGKEGKQPPKEPEIETKFNINADEAADAWGMGDDDILDNFESSQPDQTVEETPVAKRTDLFFKDEDPYLNNIKRFSSNPIDLFGIGEVEAGLKLLAYQVGLKNPVPLKRYIQELVASNAAWGNYGIAGDASLSYVLTNKAGRVHNRFTYESLREKVDTILGLVTKAKIQEAVDLLKSTNLLTLFVRPESLAEAEHVQVLKNKLLHYSICLRAKLLSDRTTDPKRKIELLFVMSSCDVEPAHRLLILQLAINALVKLENFMHALVLVHKFLKISQENPGVSKEEAVQKMRKLASACEQKGANAHEFSFREKYLYDAGIVSRVDFESLAFLFPETVPDSQVVACPFDKTAYPVALRGSLCRFCEVCEIGYDTVTYSVVEAFQKGNYK